MSFFESYKKLDNLCKDMNFDGISGYIDNMNNIADGNNFVQNWQKDYSNLIRYRHIRNQIAHDNDINEENSSTEKDVDWLNNFYQRILNQTDPLCLYRIAIKAQSTARVQAPKERLRTETEITYSKKSQSEKLQIEKLEKAEKKSDKVNGIILFLIILLITVYGLAFTLPLILFD